MELKDLSQKLQRVIDDKKQAIRDEKNAQLTSTLSAVQMASMLEPQFQDLKDSLLIGLSEIGDYISKVKIESPVVNVPETKIPTINIPEIKVPEAKVTVNIPDVIVPEIKIPEIKLPTINVPEPKVTVNVPDVIVPEIKVPQVVIPDRLNVGLQDFTRTNPLPVIQVDPKGNPVQPTVSGGGGKADFFTIKAFSQSVFSVPVNSDGQVPVSGSFVSVAPASSYVISGNAEGIPYNYDNPFPVTVTSGGTATTASNIVDSTGVAYTGSNPLPVEVSDGSVIDTGNSTTATLGISGVFIGTGVDCLGYASVATTLTSDKSSTAGGMQFQFSTDNVNWDDTYSFDFIGGTTRRFQFPVTARYFRVNYINTNSAQTYFRVQTILHKTDILTSIHRLDADVKPDRSSNLVKAGLIAQINGTGDFTPIQANAAGVLKIGGTVEVSGVTNSIAATLLNGEGLARDTWGATQVGTWNITGITNSTASALVDSSGVQYSGSNPIPTYLVASAGNSTISVGPSATGVADDGSSPVQQGGIAMTANPSPVTGGQVVKARFDDLGRQVMRPYQVRDLTKTAYLQKLTGSTFGTETTLLGGTSGAFNDLVYLTASNDSTVAATIDIRSTTAGNIVLSFTIPANGQIIYQPVMPYPQSDAGAWTVDLADITGTNIKIAALFIQEI